VQSCAPQSTKKPLFPESRPFFWLPIAGQRHAAEIRDRDLPYGGTDRHPLRTTTDTRTSNRQRLPMVRLLDHHRGVCRTAGLNRSRHG
jgi:hypothetical protein